MSRFKFAAYINPLWYFNLRTKLDYLYFTDMNNLSDSFKKSITLDEKYSNYKVSSLDTSYQILYLGLNLKLKLNINSNEDCLPTISDNYLFIKKYFNPFWYWYVLFMRLFLLNNPIRELIGFIKHYNVRKIDLYKFESPYLNDFTSFNSELVNSNPKLTIIIPTLNRYSLLKNALNDLEKQVYNNFSVIIVDQSDNFNSDFYNNFNLDIKVWYQQEKALWLARNTAIKMSNSEFIVLFEDDVRVKEDWLLNHLKCIDFFDADISAGVFYPEGSDMPKNKKYFKFADQFATGNALIKKSVFSKIALFDKQFEGQRMGDGEFGLRSYLNEIRSISNPLAYCIDLKAPFGGLRQMGSWDAWRPKSIFSPRPIPSVLYYSRKYFGLKLTIFEIVQNILTTYLPYKYKKNKIFKILSPLIFIILFPIAIISVCRSWLQSSYKLNQGPKFDFLHE